MDSFEFVRDIPTFGGLSLCGGVGLFEKTDIVAELGILAPSSLNHVPVESEAVERAADSLPNLACFSKEMLECGECDGTIWFGLSAGWFGGVATRSAASWVD